MNRSQAIEHLTQHGYEHVSLHSFFAAVSDHPLSESEDTLLQRVRSFVDDLAKNKDKNATIVIFSHGLTMTYITKVLTEKFTVVNTKDSIIKLLSEPFNGGRMNTGVDRYLLSTDLNQIEIKSIGSVNHLSVLDLDVSTNQQLYGLVSE